MCLGFWGLISWDVSLCLDYSEIFLLLCVAFSLIDVFFVISMGVLVLVLLLGLGG